MLCFKCHYGDHKFKYRRAKIRQTTISSRHWSIAKSIHPPVKFISQQQQYQQYLNVRILWTVGNCANPKIGMDSPRSTLSDLWLAASKSLQKRNFARLLRTVEVWIVDLRVPSDKWWMFKMTRPMDNKTIERKQVQYRMQLMLYIPWSKPPSAHQRRVLVYFSKSQIHLYPNCSSALTGSLAYKHSRWTWCVV